MMRIPSLVVSRKYSQSFVVEDSNDGGCGRGLHRIAWEETECVREFLYRLRIGPQDRLVVDEGRSFEFHLDLLKIFGG